MGRHVYTPARRRILSRFEQADVEPDPARKRELLSFIVIGGGPVGVELASSMRDLMDQKIIEEAREIEPKRKRQRH